MPILHRVRQYTKRKGTSVKEHLRGSGSRVKSYSGRYAGRASSRLKGASASAKMSIREKLARAKVDRENRKSQQEQEKRLAKGIYEEEKAKIAREKAAARLKQIEAEARLKAREGGFLTRSFKAALKEAKKESTRKKVREYF